MLRLAVELFFGGLYGLLVTCFSQYVIGSMTRLFILGMEQTAHKKGKFWNRIWVMFACGAKWMLSIRTTILAYEDQLRQKMEPKLLQVQELTGQKD